MIRVREVGKCENEYTKIFLGRNVVKSYEILARNINTLSCKYAPCAGSENLLEFIPLQSYE